MKSAFIILFCCLLFNFPSAHAFEEDTQFWGAWIARGSLGGSWLGYFEYQARYADQARQYDRLLVRPALGYSLNPNWQLHLGYAWTPTFRPRFNDENRYWQQSIFRTELGWGRLVWRNRFEQRLIQGIAGTSLRLREFVYFQVGTLDQVVRLAAWNELFWNFNDVSPEIKTGFDQNRFFLGMWFRLSERLTADVGYMNSVVNRHARDDRMLHNVVAYVYTDF